MSEDGSRGPRIRPVGDRGWRLAHSGLALLVLGRHAALARPRAPRPLSRPELSVRLRLAVGRAARAARVGSLAARARGALRARGRGPAARLPVAGGAPRRPGPGRSRGPLGRSRRLVRARAGERRHFPARTTSSRCSCRRRCSSPPSSSVLVSAAPDLRAALGSTACSGACPRAARSRPLIVAILATILFLLPAAFTDANVASRDSLDSSHILTCARRLLRGRQRTTARASTSPASTPCSPAVRAPALELTDTRRAPTRSWRPRSPRRRCWRCAGALPARPSELAGLALYVPVLAISLVP